MRVAFINETCGTGSIGKLTLDLMEHLEQMGIESFCFYSNKAVTNHNTFKIGNIPEKKIHALLSRITGLQGYFSFHATYSMLRRLRSIKPDIVVLENLHANYINLSILFGYLKKESIPTVLILHDCWFYTGKCTYYVPANCVRWQSECGNCPLLFKDNVNPTFIFDRTKKSLRDKKRMITSLPKVAVVGVSNWITDEAKMSFLGKYHPLTIYNWVDRQVFRKLDTKEIVSRLGVADKKVVLMVTSRISTIKGYDELLYISEKIKSEQFQVIIVGKNTDQLMIPGTVIHIPYTESIEELALLYNVADVCVNTTKYETFGMVTAESLCCGTPVIVYDNTASSELINEDCGVVVKDGDKAGIIDAIRHICEMGKQHYTIKCVEYAASKFEVGRAVKDYVELFENIL